MRRLTYAVAAVLALAPLAAIAPASAAVAHPAAAQVVCDGHEEASVANTPNSPGVYSWWYVGPNAVNDKDSASTEFCVLPEGKVNNNYAFAFRQTGTSLCVNYNSGNANVVMQTCNSSSASQKWQISHPGTQTGVMTNVYQPDGTTYLQGNGKDSPLFFTASDGQGDQSWTIFCDAGPCAL